MSMSIDECQKPRPGFPRPIPDTPESVFAQLRLTDRVAVVTGTAEGLGLAVADAYAEAGAHVAMWYNSLVKDTEHNQAFAYNHIRNDKAVENAEQIAKQYGVKTKAYKVDEAEQVQKTIAEVIKDFGSIDIFVANAGMANSKPLLEMSLEEYHQLVAVNTHGVVYCAKFAGEVFKKQGRGNLIITGSISAHVVNVPVDQPVYNGTKAFITHLGKSLAREWREFARVNIVSPGFFDTKMGAGPSVITEGLRMTPLGRQGHVKEIKGVFLYLASDASSYQTGSDVIIDGGYTLP